MYHLLKRILLVLALGGALVPAMGFAGSISGGEDKNDSSSATNSVSSPTPALQQQEFKYLEIAPSGGHPALSGESGVQENTPVPAAGKEQKEHITVVYDRETEKDRGILITLTIAFGISLALNIYLATSLIAAKRGM